VNDSTSDSDLEFDGELLVPKINLAAYRQIYALEGWFRRICLTAWMGRFGEPWSQRLDQGLRKALESRVQRSRQRLYLGAESASDLIWQATQAELTRMLVAEPVTEMVRSLTGTDSEFLKIKLEEIREIRNLLAHNRALSRRTHIILAGLLASLEDAVDTFKANLLYRQSDPGTLDGLISSERGPFQGFVAQRGDFNEFVCLPVERFGRWPDARLLLRIFREHLDGIVAFCLNKTGDEFIILSPLVLADESREAIHEKFIENRNVWTETPFEDQEPRFVCSPKIWFYENRSPVQADIY
jgi:hypothetical protein